MAAQVLLIIEGLVAFVTLGFLVQGFVGPTRTSFPLGFVTFCNAVYTEYLDAAIAVVPALTSFKTSSL